MNPDLQYFVDRLPGKPNRDTIASQIENSSTPITTDQALNAWYEHDALHYLSEKPFTDEGEEFVAYLEKRFNRGWLPFGEKYNTYYQKLIYYFLIVIYHLLSEVVMLLK